MRTDVRSLQVGPAGAIILSDILHYLEPGEQETLIMKCMSALKPEGVLLIREGDRDMEKKHRRTKMTEFFSTRLFAFNKTGGRRLHFLSGQTIHQLASGSHMTCHSIDHSDLTSNQVFIIRHPVITYEKI